ncbi:MAG: hypothetical protein K8R54_11240 [Bacteroidales bacterium]|nr:hypothetical protein [Bacteroidales bacterium]
MDEIPLIYSKDTLIIVKEQFTSKKKRIPIDIFDMNFRLFLTDNNTINLEILISTFMGNRFKAIGFFDEKINIYILSEFEKDLDDLKKKQFINTDLIIELIMTFDGFPQFFLDDKYNNSSPIAAYIKEDGNLQILPMAEFQTETQKLHEMNLLGSIGQYP